MSLNEVKGEEFRGGRPRREMCHCDPMRPSLKRGEDTLVVKDVMLNALPCLSRSRATEGFLVT